MRIRSVIVFLIGGAIIAAALFADVIGLDNDPGWGKGRIAILVFGILIIAGGIFDSLRRDKTLSISRQIQSRLSENLFGLTALLRRYWYTLPILILVILIYIWFASSGSWTHWESATRYYADLANSFKQGKLHLTTRPDADLLKLSNPYDPLARHGVEFLIDYSLYNGKFYLYWGPVPALLLMGLSLLTQGKVGDLYLVFSFICGIFLWQSLLAITIWDRFFRDLPKWMLPLSILMLGLTAPWTYMLINEPNGRIYEAAISGAQFFLTAGFLIAVVAFCKTGPSTLSLASIGFLWALSIGTRLVMAVPIGFLILMIAYRVWNTTRPSPMNFVVKLISLSLPTVLCLVGLGWYNWARFGSVTETGFSYALAGVNLQKYQNDLFSPVYVIQNLYNYTLNLPASTGRFPFLLPGEGINTEIFGFYSLPEVYETSPVTGLLFLAPFTVFVIVPIITLLMNVNRNKKDNDLLDWIVTSVLIAHASASCFLLIFFWAALRYLGDFMPALTMASLLGFWQGYKLLAQRPIQQRIYSSFGIILAITSIVMNILLSISVQQLGRAGF